MQNNSRVNPLRQWLISAGKLALAAIVLYAVGRQLAGDLAKLRSVELAPLWLIASAVFYAVGLSFFAEFWRAAVLKMGGSIGVWEAQRAYIVSQLGKYVPGKALSIVMRCGLTRRESVTVSVAVIASFYETLALMAVGSAVSLAALAAVPGIPSSLMWLAAGLTVSLLILTLPPVFSRAVALVALPFKKRGEQLARPVDYGILGWAVLWLVPGWIMQGLSVAAAGAGIGVSMVGCGKILPAIGAAGLSTACGFVMIFLPAGLGAREYILTQTLAPTLGPGPAALIAVVSRVAQVVVELAAGAALLAAGKRWADNRASGSGAEDASP